MKNLVKFYRDSIGITQEELANLVGVSRVQISNIERNKHIPNILLAQAIAKVLGTTTDELFWREEK